MFLHLASSLWSEKKIESELVLRLHSQQMLRWEKAEKKIISKTQKPTHEKSSWKRKQKSCSSTSSSRIVVEGTLNRSLDKSKMKNLVQLEHLIKTWSQQFFVHFLFILEAICLCLCRAIILFHNRNWFSNWITNQADHFIDFYFFGLSVFKKSHANHEMWPTICKTRTMRVCFLSSVNFIVESIWRIKAVTATTIEDTKRTMTRHFTSQQTKSAD